MSDSEQAFDEEYAPDGTLIRRTARPRDRVLSDDDIRALRVDCRQIMQNTNVPAWGRMLARAVLGLTWEPTVQTPPSANPRRLDENGYDIPNEPGDGKPRRRDE